MQYKEIKNTKWKLLNLSRSAATVVQRCTLMRGSEKSTQVFISVKNWNPLKCPSRELDKIFYTNMFKE